MNIYFLFFKSLRELGFKSLSLYALYKFGLATGHYRRLTRKPSQPDKWNLNPVLLLPSKNELLKVLGQDGQEQLFAEAEGILEGKIRLFGGDVVTLRLSGEGALLHWTDYERGKVPYPQAEHGDVKFIWEPARFGWAYTLGRAYLASGDERYSQSFWNRAETFLESNPPYLGPQWTSGQEVAIRLMALVWAGQVFVGSPESTPERKEKLSAAIAAHAERIPITLVYARSQNNNHLISEAAGLYTAGMALPDHPCAETWRTEGWKWLEWAFKKQILEDGSYVQHSTNYHRLMLQIALWVWTLANLSPARRGGMPQKIEAQLALAARWLSALTDRQSGQIVNLGANDGALIFPLTICPFSDYRPVVQAASLAFTGEKPFKDGPWNEMALWFGQKLSLIERYSHSKRPPHKLILESQNSWAYLRAVKLKSRPSHADQLHLDLWWRGMNIARDAGTYLYNAASPWDNSLTITQVHNTVTFDGHEQMTRAGRFLYLDRALAGIISDKRDGDSRCVTARMHGYKSLGITHDRKVTAGPSDNWLIEDVLTAKYGDRTLRNFRLHWLLPDWEWKLDQQAEKTTLGIKSPQGWISIGFTTSPGDIRVTLARAGERLLGEGSVMSQAGWFSPTYGWKEPALSIAVEVPAVGTVAFSSQFTFPEP